MKLALAVAVAGLLVAPQAVLAASQASLWAESMHSRVRLVRGAEQAAGIYDIGIQIQLDADWKTYWRMPGDAGIPPEFDFERSGNLASFEVLWPAPEWFEDEYGDSVGYHDEVVFPVIVTAADDGAPVSLDVTVHYAVCLDICIPAMAELALDLEEIAATPLYAGLIASYRHKVPLAATEVEGLAVSAVEVEAVGEGAVRLVVDVACTDPDAEIGLFVEGPEAYYFGRPVALAGAPEGHKRFAVPVTGAHDRQALAGAELELTVVEGDRGIEQAWTLP